MTFDPSSGISPPVGAILPWHKSKSGTPSLPPEFVECNGQTLNDPDSPFDGQTIPDINGNSSSEKFIRGNTTSGNTGGGTSHSHNIQTQEIESDFGSGAEYRDIVNANSTGTESVTPTNIEMVHIMRVK